MKGPISVYIHTTLLTHDNINVLYYVNCSSLEIALMVQSLCMNLNIIDMYSCPVRNLYKLGRLLENGSHALRKVTIHNVQPTESSERFSKVVDMVIRHTKVE